MGIEAKKVDFSKINEVKSGDSITPEHINAPLRASALAQSLATNQPNTENVDKVGTPSVEIETLSDGTKRLKFSNLKGEQGTSVEVDDYLDGNSTNPVQNKVVTEAIVDAVSKAESALLGASNAADKADEVSQNLYAYQYSNDMEVGLLKSDVEQLKQSGGSGGESATGLYLHKVSFSTRTAEDPSYGAYNADVIELVILNKQSTQLTKDYFLSLGASMFNTAISKVFYIESQPPDGYPTIANETTRFDIQQIGEYTFEVFDLGYNLIGTMDFSTLGFYDRVIDL